MADPNTIQQKPHNDTRIACKFGAKCYQKNPLHLQKYRHPPPKIPPKNNKQPMETEVVQAAKKIKLDVNTKAATQTLNKPSGNNEELNVNNESTKMATIEEKPNAIPQDLGRTSKDFDQKEFIKQKFLMDMPDDFYDFWNFCKSLKEKCPQEALKDIGLELVGPFDVLAGKFNDVKEQPDETYLLHWRYYYDPPECQTVIKGDDRTGYHVGYYRDSPKDLPVFLVSNCMKTNGEFSVMGDNIFAAVYLYLEDLKKNGDPFKKMHIARFQNALKEKAEELKLSLSQTPETIKKRNKKIVTRSFNRIGLVVPYNRKTQMGYRDLGISNKELRKLLDNIQSALPEQRQTYLSKLQDILTNVSIATDECDFGTGIELGLDILAHGVDSLNTTISRYLVTNYRLIDREVFAKIVEAHMMNRKKGTNLSIL